MQRRGAVAGPPVRYPAAHGSNSHLPVRTRRRPLDAVPVVATVGAQEKVAGTEPETNAKNDAADGQKREDRGLK